VLHFLRVSLGFLTPSRDLRIVCAVLGLKRAIHVIRVLARGSQVFEPAIKEDLELSADDIETALVSNNGNLARLHIALLKVVYLPPPPPLLEGVYGESLVSTSVSCHDLCSNHVRAAVIVV
jgi:hypothetical protein